MKEIKILAVLLGIIVAMVVTVGSWAFGQKYSASIFYDTLNVQKEEYECLEGLAVAVARGKPINKDVEVTQYIDDNQFIVDLKKDVGNTNYKLRAIFPLSKNGSDISIQYEKVRYFHIGNDTYGTKSFFISCMIAFCAGTIVFFISWKVAIIMELKQDENNPYLFERKT